MRSIKCEKCGHEFGKSAATCPSCGAKNPKHISGKQLFLSLIALIVVSSCVSNMGKRSADKVAKGQAMDQDASHVASCDSKSVSDLSVPTVSWQDTSTICGTMARKLGHTPSAQALRSMSKVAYMIKRENGADINDVAYQIMHIVELRGRIEDESAMLATFDLVWKAFSGTQGRVAPADLVLMLSNAGSLARTMSDEGFVNMAALVSVEKRERTR